jgi:hypothetical protein
MNILKQLYHNAVALLKVMAVAVTWPFKLAKEELQGKEKSVRGCFLSFLRAAVWVAFATVTLFFPAAPVLVIALASYLAWIDTVIIFSTFIGIGAATVIGNIYVNVLSTVVPRAERAQVAPAV